MKKILFLSFYYTPDLSAGSFRNTPLSEQLAKDYLGEVHVMTTLPNRYSTFKSDAKGYEDNGNLKIWRFEIPAHKSGIKDQIKSFYTYFKAVRREARKHEYELVFASSSRLFTAFLGSFIARRKRVPLYLDIRDIFLETINDVLSNKLFKVIGIPFIRAIERYTFSKADHVNIVSEGFRDYFGAKYNTRYSFNPNGIDQIFLDYEVKKANNLVPRILYAGNFGDSQGLDRIVAQASEKLTIPHEFVLFGDGGAKQKLLEQVASHANCKVRIESPINRSELLIQYASADILFLHLNDLPAFERVLPSKVFEYGALQKPILAGVSGYSANFIRTNLEGAEVFEPCDVEGLMVAAEKLLSGPRYYQRLEFCEKFNRVNITERLSQSILSYTKG